MMQFASTFPDFQIVTSLMSQLSWTYFLQVLSIEDNLRIMDCFKHRTAQNWPLATTEGSLNFSVTLL